jgi:hypothetical protein
MFVPLYRAQEIPRDRDFLVAMAVSTLIIVDLVVCTQQRIHCVIRSDQWPSQDVGVRLVARNVEHAGKSVTRSANGNRIWFAGSGEARAPGF